MAKFVKGQSGNPGGRPKEIPHDMRELCRSRTVEAVTVLYEIMRNPKNPPMARVNAAEALLDRAWGRPAQAIVAEVSTGFNMSSLSMKERIEMLTRAKDEERGQYFGEDAPTPSMTHDTPPPLAADAQQQAAQ